MKNINRILLLFFLAFSLQFISVAPADAQCPMCRMSAESNLKNGGSSGQGLNNGIIYMLLAPYMLVGIVGFIWWRNRKTEEEEELLVD